MCKSPKFNWGLRHSDENKVQACTVSSCQSKVGWKLCGSSLSQRVLLDVTAAPPSCKAYQKTEVFSLIFNKVLEFWSRDACSVRNARRDKVNPPNRGPYRIIVVIVADAGFNTIYIVHSVKLKAFNQKRILGIEAIGRSWD